MKSQVAAELQAAKKQKLEETKEKVFTEAFDKPTHTFPIQKDLRPRKIAPKKMKLNPSAPEDLKQLTIFRTNLKEKLNSTKNTSMPKGILTKCNTCGGTFSSLWSLHKHHLKEHMS